MSRSWVASRVSRLGAAFGLAVVATVVLAAEPVASGPEVIRFHVAPDGSTATFSFGATTQSLTPLTRCEITGTNGPLIKLSSNRKVGMSSNGIGVKTGGSQGTPCGRVDSTENLTLSTVGTGTAGLDGRLMHKLVLDMEMKGNAKVQLRLFRSGVGQVGPTYELQTGSSIDPGLVPQPGPPYMATSTSAAPVVACANPSDSGPDSGANDNCLWTVDPGSSALDFDTATFTVMVGEFSLEGSGDFGGDPTYDTLLHLSNRAPVATNDDLSTPEDTPLSADVLGNDSDADGDPLTVTAVNGDPSKVGVSIPLTGGSVTIGSNGSLSFTPNLNFNGNAGSVGYTISDGQGAFASATVTITVTPVNDPPVATASSPSVDEDGSVNIPIATDVENDPLTVTCTEPSSGVVVDQGDGSVTYTPDPDFNGGDSFDCTASDGQDPSNTVTISVTVNPVNDDPIATDDSAETNEDDAVVIDVLDNDTDIDGDALFVSAITSDPANGTADITNGGADVTYTPGPGHLGIDSFVYEVSDGNGGTDTATVTVETFEVICANETVSDTEGSYSVTITRFGDVFGCKRFVIDADSTAQTVLFQPADGPEVEYRGFLELGGTTPPALGSPVNLFLEYDPTGGDTFRAVPWCVDPAFDASGNVTAATIPGYPGETWCIASAYTRGVGPELLTTWQVYGKDDPKFR